MAVNIPWMLLSSLYSSPLSFFRCRFPSSFVPANRGSIILRVAEFQFTLLVPSFILDRGARFKTKTSNWLCPQYPRMPLLFTRITRLPSKKKKKRVYLSTKYKKQKLNIKHIIKYCFIKNMIWYFLFEIYSKIDAMKTKKSDSFLGINLYKLNSHRKNNLM